MENKKILVIVPTGFEDTELITTLDVLNRSNVSYDLFSIENKKIIKGQNKAIVEATVFEEKNLKDYDGIFLPGGSGHKIMLESNLVLNLLKHYYENGKLVSAICAAPSVLKKAKILDNKKFTAYPGFVESKNNTGNEVEVDKNIITGRDFEATLNFAKSIVEFLKK